MIKMQITFNLETWLEQLSPEDLKKLKCCVDLELYDREVTIPDLQKKIQETGDHE